MRHSVSMDAPHVQPEEGAELPLPHQRQPAHCWDEMPVSAPEVASLCYRPQPGGAIQATGRLEPGFVSEASLPAIPQHGRPAGQRPDQERCDGKGQMEAGLPRAPTSSSCLLDEPCTAGHQARTPFFPRLSGFTFVPHEAREAPLSCLSFLTSVS